MPANKKRQDKYSGLTGSYGIDWSSRTSPTVKESDKLLASQFLTNPDGWQLDADGRHYRKAVPQNSDLNSGLGYYTRCSRYGQIEMKAGQVVISATDYRGHIHRTNAR